MIKTAHEITALDSSLGNYLRYNTLCIELIDCLCKSILKKKNPKVLHRELEDDHHELYLRIENITNVEGIADASKFEDAFENWSRSSCGNMTRRREEVYTTLHPIVLDYPQSYIKVFYEYDDSVVINGAGPVKSEVAFIEAFRKTLNALV